MTNRSDVKKVHKKTNAHVCKQDILFLIFIIISEFIIIQILTS